MPRLRLPIALSVLSVLSILLVLAVPSIQTAAAEIVGRARAVDGVTLEIAGRLIRLHGIAAPAAGSPCVTAHGPDHCNLQAGFALAEILELHWITCVEHGATAIGIVLAVCHAGHYDINASMVRSGWATADNRVAPHYLPYETQARAERRGMWGSGL